MFQHKLRFLKLKDKTLNSCILQAFIPQLFTACFQSIYFLLCYQARATFLQSPTLRHSAHTIPVHWASRKLITIVSVFKTQMQ